jgi:hypothetical protein
MEMTWLRCWAMQGNLLFRVEKRAEKARRPAKPEAARAELIGIAPACLLWK